MAQMAFKIETLILEKFRVHNKMSLSKIGQTDLSHSHHLSVIIKANTQANIQRDIKAN